MRKSAFAAQAPECAEPKCAAVERLFGLGAASTGTDLRDSVPEFLPAGFSPCPPERVASFAECADLRAAGCVVWEHSALQLGAELFPIPVRFDGTSRRADANTPGHSGQSRRLVLQAPALL